MSDRQSGDAQASDRRAGDAPLVEVLADQARLGTLGTTPAEAIAHSERFVRALEGVVGEVLDLGSGAGVPGLVIAWRRPDLHVTLLDARQRRADQLARLVGRLRLTQRVSVVAAPAERHLAAADQAGRFAAVVARAFGPVEQVIDLAIPVLAGGGRLVISRPPALATPSPDLPAGDALVPVACPDQGLWVFERLAHR